MSPTYEYHCNQCATVFDTTRSYKERETNVNCPNCSQVSSRIYNTPSVVFKGSGFYKTGG